jgi:hypothetical protein
MVGMAFAKRKKLSVSLTMVAAMQSFFLNGWFFTVFLQPGLARL